MGGAGATGGTAGGAGAAPNGESARGAQCPVVLGAGGLSVAPAPPRVPALDGGAVLLRQVGGGRDLGRDQQPPGGADARAPGARGAAHGGGHRQPEQQDHRSGRGARLRWRKKKSPAASGTIWWIRKGICWRCWSRRRIGRIATARGGCFARLTSAGRRCRRFGPITPTTATWRRGSGRHMGSTWKWSSTHRAKRASQCCPGGGS